MKQWIAAVALASLGGWAQADGLQSLEQFMKGSQAGEAQFTQTVTSPPKQDQTSRVKTSSGSFAFQRPGKFKFIYQKPFDQTIVADGTVLTVYDADLNQVTQRQQSKALGQTPAALLASASSLQALKAEFDVSSLPEADGQQWVQAVPKNKDGQIKLVKVGFKGDALQTLEIEDGFGQRSVLRFVGFKALPSLPGSSFEFAIPSGAEVIRQ